jgi:hypothetical protein
MILIAFDNCGQSFDRDVGIYEVSREELVESIERCRSVDTVDELWEIIDGEEYDVHVYSNLSVFEDWLTHNREDVYLYLKHDDDWLMYFGPDQHFATVVGSIVAVQYGKGHLPDEIE